MATALSICWRESKGCHNEGIMRSLQGVIKRPLKVLYIWGEFDDLQCMYFDIRLEPRNLLPPPPLMDLTWNNLLEWAFHTSSNFMTPPAVIRKKNNAFQKSEFMPLTRIKRTPKCRSKMIVPPRHKAELPGFMSVAWPTEVQLLVFFWSSVPVMLLDYPGISRCWQQHVVSVESSSLFHRSIYPWFICFPRWSTFTRTEQL